MEMKTISTITCNDAIDHSSIWITSIVLIKMISSVLGHHRAKRQIVQDINADNETSRTMIRCGFYNCDINYQWCDTVTNDCSRCDVFCKNVWQVSDKMGSFCFQHCPRFMENKAQISTTIPPSPSVITTTDMAAPLLSNYDMNTVMLIATLTLLTLLTITVVAAIIAFTYFMTNWASYSKETKLHYPWKDRDTEKHTRVLYVNAQGKDSLPNFSTSDTPCDLNAPCHLKSCDQNTCSKLPGKNQTKWNIPNQCPVTTAAEYSGSDHSCCNVSRINETYPGKDNTPLNASQPLASKAQLLPQVSTSSEDGDDVVGKLTPFVHADV